MDLLHSLPMGPFSVRTNSVTRGCASILATHPDHLPTLDKVDTHWDFQITVMTVETILWIKLVPRDMLKVLNSL